MGSTSKRPSSASSGRSQLGQEGAPSRLFLHCGVPASLSLLDSLLPGWLSPPSFLLLFTHLQFCQSFHLPLLQCRPIHRLVPFVSRHCCPSPVFVTRRSKNHFRFQTWEERRGLSRQASRANRRNNNTFISPTPSTITTAFHRRGHQHHLASISRRVDLFESSWCFCSSETAISCLCRLWTDRSPFRTTSSPIHPLLHHSNPYLHRLGNRGLCNRVFFTQQSLHQRTVESDCYFAPSFNPLQKVREQSDRVSADKPGLMNSLTDRYSFVNK